MAPQLALYIFGGCVVASIGLLVVMLVIPALRVPQPPTVRVTPHPSSGVPQASRLQKTARVMPLDRIASTARTRYREGALRKLYRCLVIALVPSLIITAVVIAYPPLLYPLCDGYAWFGDDAVAAVREHARSTHNLIAGLLTRR
jgi:hypothetical protein